VARKETKAFNLPGPDQNKIVTRNDTDNSSFLIHKTRK